MKVVNFHFVRKLLDPFLGLSDEEVTALMQTDPNDEKTMRKVIRELIVTEYARYGPKSKQVTKDSFRYLLCTDNVLLEEILDISTQHVFNLPDPPRKFFLWLWQELFGNEDFSVMDTKEYVVQNDEATPNLAYIR